MCVRSYAFIKYVLHYRSQDIEIGIIGLISIFDQYL